MESRKELRTKRKRKKVRNVTIATLAAGLAVLLGVGAFAVFLAGEFDRNRGIVEDAITTPVPTASSTETGQPVALKSQNILVMGTDTRGSLQGLDMEGTRSDTMLLAHIEADRQHVQIISLPRDTWVKINNSKGKLNWAFSYGGAKLAVKTIQDLIGIHIDHVVLIDFKGVRQITKVLGGITVDNPTTFTNGRDASHYIFTYQAGKVTLNENNALGFVRERHAFAGGDGDRVIHQQLFAKGLIARVLDLDVLANPATLLELTKTVGKLVNVDRGFDSQYILNLAWEMRSFKVDNLKTFTLPLSSTGHEGQHYVVYADQAELKKLTDAFANDTLDDYVVPPVIETRN